MPRQLSARRTLGPVIQFRMGEEIIADIPVHDIEPGQGIRLVTDQALAEHAHFTHRDFFAYIRHTSGYEHEWMVLQALSKGGPTALSMVNQARLALAAQFAVEACAAYPELEGEAYRWLKRKFKKEPHFEAKWKDYMSVRGTLLTGEPQIYERFNEPDGSISIRVLYSDC